MTRLGLAVLVVLIGMGAGQALGGPIGPPCTGCNDGFYYTGSGCMECTGGANYDCGPGSYRTGRACLECIGESDTQTCAICGNGGVNYQCPAGKAKIGSACSGTSSSDTQVCGTLAPAVSNQNALLLGAALLLAGLWSVRRLPRPR